MRVVIDTNVFVSAVFFGGIPGKVLKLWRDDRIEHILTAEVLAEYEDIVHRLRDLYPSVAPDPIVSLVVRRGTFVQPLPLAEGVCADHDDDKFLAAALGGADCRQRGWPSTDRFGIQADPNTDTSYVHREIRERTRTIRLTGNPLRSIPAGDGHVDQRRVARLRRVVRFVTDSLRASITKRSVRMAIRRLQTNASAIRMGSCQSSGKR